jgi:hypothetical protein
MIPCQASKNTLDSLKKGVKIVIFGERDSEHKYTSNFSGIKAEKITKNKSAQHTRSHPLQ